MNKIEELRTCSPGSRVKVIEQLYQKNIDFFSRYRPDIIELIDKITCPYEISITETFLDLVDSKTRSIAHPPSLDDFAEALGQRNHGAWVDNVNVEKSVIAGSPIHQEILDTFSENLYKNFPVIQGRLESGKTTISTHGAGYNAFPPVTFAGIFHGLHIDYFLRYNKINRILLVEPEPERFEVSCYFLDYEWVYNKFGYLPLSIGTVIDKTHLHYFHSADKITSSLWTRVLPVYDSLNNQTIIDQVRLNQSILEGQTTSYDKEINALILGQKNIELKHKILSKSAYLSSNSKVALIASGPSLKAEMVWLRDNQNKLIVIAVHTAVKPLRENGIDVDFQVSLDTHLESHQFEAMGLDKRKPLVSYYKCPTEFINDFSNALLVTEKNYINSVNFNYSLENAHPSSTNLALAFMAFFNPKEIYLFGVDAGYKNTEERFVNGGFHDLFKRKTDQSMYEVEANNPETGTVITTPFFFKVKQSVETIIHRYKDTKVFNCSDGAKIHGADFLDTSEISLSGYAPKKQDIETIIDSFKPAIKGQNFSLYEMSGEALTHIYFSKLIKELDLDEYDWCEFANRIDSCLQKSISSTIERSKCLRMTVYERTVVELLLSWYRMFLLAADAKEAEDLYKIGKLEMEKAVRKLTWPLNN